MMNLSWHILLPAIISGAKVTGLIVLCAYSAGICVGVALSALRLTNVSVLVLLVKSYVTFFRVMPLAVVLLVFSLVIPDLMPTPLVRLAGGEARVICCIVGFALFEGAYVEQILFSAYRAIRTGQLPSGLALGMTRFQVFCHILLPQMLRFSLPALVTQGIVVVQDSSLVYLVGGVPDLFSQLYTVGQNYGSVVPVNLIAAVIYATFGITVSHLVSRFAASRNIAL